MADETTSKSWLDSFLNEAKEQQEEGGNRVSGRYAQVSLNSGYYVYGAGEANQLFLGGGDEASNEQAHDESHAYASDLGFSKNIVLAIQVVTYGGTQYPEAKNYNTDDGNLTQMVMNFSSQNPDTKEWDNPGVSWKTLVESFSQEERDHPVRSSMMEGTGKFWAHVVSRPHPYFDVDNPDTHVKYVAQFDIDGDLNLNDKDEAQPEYLVTIKAAFETREELITYAYGLGVEADDVATSNAPEPAVMWKDTPKEWVESWPSIRELLEKTASGAKPLRVKASDELANDWGVEVKEQPDLVKWMSENPA